MPYSLNMRVRGAALIISDDQLLLVEYYTVELGLHYVLPGGALEGGENLRDTVRREVFEETCLRVDPGQVVMAYEYCPRRDSHARDLPPALTLVFDCPLTGGASRLPDCPDPGQTGVRWIPLDELDSLRLSPPIQPQIMAWAYEKKRGVDLVEEWRLGS